MSPTNKLSTARKIWSVLTLAERRSAVVLLGLMFIGMVLGTLGVGLVIPVLQPALQALDNPSQQSMAVGGILVLAGVYLIKVLFLTLLVQRYIIELSKPEKNELVENFHRFDKLKHFTVNPKAFAEKGLYMLATILKKPSMIQDKADQKSRMQKSRELIAEIFEYVPPYWRTKDVGAAPDNRRTIQSRGIHVQR